MLELLARGALEADGRGRGEGPAEAFVPVNVLLRKIEMNPGPAFVVPCQFAVIIETVMAIAPHRVGLARFAPCDLGRPNRDDLVAMLFVCGPTTVRIRHGATIAHEEHDEEGPTSSARVEDSRGPQK